MSGEIRSIIVAGTGPLPWIAAAGLSRAFRHRQLDVTVVDSGASCDARVGRWTLPSQRGMVRPAGEFRRICGNPNATVERDCALRQRCGTGWCVAAARLSVWTCLLFRASKDRVCRWRSARASRTA